MGESDELVSIIMFFKIFIIMIIMAIFMIKLMTTAMKVVDKDDANDSKYDCNCHNDHHGCDIILTDSPVTTEDHCQVIEGAESADQGLYQCEVSGIKIKKKQSHLIDIEQCDVAKGFRWINYLLMIHRDARLICGRNRQYSI